MMNQKQSAEGRLLLFSLALLLLGAALLLGRPNPVTAATTPGAGPRQNFYVNMYADAPEYSLEYLLEQNACVRPPITIPDPTIFPCAIRNALTMARSGGTIVIPAGTFMITNGELEADAASTVEFAGAGREDTIIYAGSGRFLNMPWQQANFTIRDLTISNGYTLGVGGAILTKGNLLLDNVRITNSFAGNSGGAIAIWDGYTGGAGLATLTVQNSLIDGNTAEQTGGAIVVYDGTAQLIMSNSRVTNNETTVGNSQGGGLSLSGPAHISNSRIDNNRSILFAGGINSFVNLTLIGSTVRDNRTNYSTGGILLNTSSSATIQSSTIYSNTAGNLAGGINVDNNVSLTIENSTVSNNQAAVQGGGFYIDTGGSAIIRHTTVVDNDAPAGASIYNYAGSVQFDGSIMAAAAPTAFGGGGAPPAGCFGGVTSLGYNVLGVLEPDCSLGALQLGDAAGVDPALLPLADNEGGTLTYMPQVGSPTVDRASCGFLTVDQRGVSRPQGTACDTGAVEQRAGEGETPTALGLSQLRSGTSTAAVWLGLLSLLAGGSLLLVWGQRRRH